MFLTALVESFETSSVESLRALAAAVEAGDVEALGREAHRFKGEASTLGAGGVAELCVELEQMQAPLDRVAAGQRLSRADQEMQRVLHDLQVELGTAQVS